MPIPAFVVEMRKLIGQREMWLPAVTAVVTRGEGTSREVLLVRRAEDGRWTPITGIMDPGEEPAPAAARETLEETGVQVCVDRLASTKADPGIVHANGDRASYLDLTFACSYVSGEAHVADDESSDVRWFPLDALPEMDPRMTRRIAEALSGEQAARFVS